MNEITILQAQMRDRGMANWAEMLPEQLSAVASNAHGDVSRWQTALSQLPDVVDPVIDLNTDQISIGITADLTTEQHTLLLESLKQMHPWRKGPFSIFGHDIDTEWRSDWKWQRLIDAIEPLSGRAVLDVGCGNGYHCWRMAGAGAELVIGIDPTQLFVAQFQALQKYMGSRVPVYLLPLGIEQVPVNQQSFDTVFSMGVLYHRRSPIDHLQELAGTLRPGGQLVLETLVVEGDVEHVLVPRGRYAKMRNVWFIPSAEALENWLRRAGFNNIKLVDVTTTTTSEQRSTEWMHFESLADYLDPNDSARTIEGYPAPMRAILTATR